MRKNTENITSRQYQILADHMDIYQFMIEIYERDWRNGVPAPFLEYALSSDWMDLSYTHRNKIWLDGGKIVGFVFTEKPVTDIYFSLRPGYEKNWQLIWFCMLTNICRDVTGKDSWSYFRDRMPS